MKWEHLCGCSKLSNVSIPDAIEYIGDYVFDDCTSMNKIIIPETNGTIELGGSINNTVPDVAILGNVIELKSWNFGFGKLKNLILGSENVEKGLRTISNGSFGGHSDIESVIINKSVEIIGAGAFGGCTNLKNVILPEGLITINAGAFSNTKLEKISIPSTVTTIDSHSFAHINDLKVLTIKKGTETLNIKKSAFYNSSNLTDIYYTGTQEDWNTLVNIDNTDDENASFNNATKHFGQEAT